MHTRHNTQQVYHASRSGKTGGRCSCPHGWSRSGRSAEIITWGAPGQGNPSDMDLTYRWDSMAGRDSASVSLGAK